MIAIDFDGRFAMNTVHKPRLYSYDEVLEIVKELQSPDEDDDETNLYRHCEEGDYWKCAGFGDTRCVCRCHALKEIIKKLASLERTHEGEDKLKVDDIQADRNVCTICGHINSHYTYCPKTQIR